MCCPPFKKDVWPVKFTGTVGLTDNKIGASEAKRKYIKCNITGYVASSAQTL